MYLIPIEIIIKTLIIFLTKDLVKKWFSVSFSLVSCHNCNGMCELWWSKPILRRTSDGAMHSTLLVQSSLHSIPSETKMGIEKMRVSNLLINISRAQGCKEIILLPRYLTRICL